MVGRKTAKPGKSLILFVFFLGTFCATLEEVVKWVGGMREKAERTEKFNRLPVTLGRAAIFCCS